MSVFSGMMSFRVVYRSIIDNILGPGAQGRFRVLDYPMTLEGADGVLNNDRAVSVYFDKATFKRGSFRYPDPDVVYNIDLLVAADSKADLLVLDQNFENEQRDIYFDAINRLQDAESRAENLINELIEIVYQLVMSPENDALGVDRIDPSPNVCIGDRDITMIEKGSPSRKGNKVMLGAQMTLECNFDEKIFGGQEPLGEEGAGGTIDAEFDLKPKS